MSMFFCDGDESCDMSGAFEKRDGECLEVPSADE